MPVNCFLRPRIALAAVMAALAVSAASANNVTDGYYVFTADANQATSMNGSWVEISGESLIDWNLVDTSVPANYSWLSAFPGYGYPTYFPPLTLANSSVIDFSTYPTGLGSGPDSFSFIVGSPIGGGTSVPAVFTVSGENNVNGGPGFAYQSSIYDNATFNQVTQEVTDPMGTWTFELTRPGDTSGVPDVSRTLALLLAGFAALAGFAVLGRRETRTPVRVRVRETR